MAVYNERGVIAESYHDLQGLGALRAARERYPLPKASGESTVRAVFQSVELALLNLSDVVTRATADLARGEQGPAVVKMFWARGFHRVLLRLSAIPYELGLAPHAEGRRGVLRIQESPAFNEYVSALRSFDREVLLRIESGDLPATTALAEQSLASVDFNLLHLARVCNYESTIWEKNLAGVPVPADVPSYDEFVVAQGLREAVYERVLAGDTYFTQFRGLHQIPETLSEEINDHLEQCVRHLRSAELREAFEHLRIVNVLTEGVLASLPPMADNLATSDYHRIRENLGLTSGSHSVSLRYHLFTHLYEQLWEDLIIHITGRSAKDVPEEDLEEAVRQVDGRRSEDPHAWMVHQLFNQCLKLRAFLYQWRDQHIHLPRNNLGGESTKSLTGSPDAVKAVKQMSDKAKSKDPITILARARGLLADNTVQNKQLSLYFESPSSLDAHLLATTGHITQARFADVQERLGFFANKSAFTPPPRRKVE